MHGLSCRTLWPAKSICAHHSRWAQFSLLTVVRPPAFHLSYHKELFFSVLHTLAPVFLAFVNAFIFDHTVRWRSLQIKPAINFIILAALRGDKGSFALNIEFTAAGWLTVSTLAALSTRRSGWWHHKWLCMFMVLPVYLYFHQKIAFINFVCKP